MAAINGQDSGSETDEGDPIPAAPPPEKLAGPQGYENVGFENQVLPPPPPNYADVAAKSIELAHNLVQISEDDARTALVEYVARQNCCYGKSAASDMNFQSINNFAAIDYKLETFTESRSTAWTQTPFINGSFVDGPHNGPAPGPWDIVIPVQDLFVDATLTADVPHTAMVRPCHYCGAVGTVMCRSCRGLGSRRCRQCAGTGHRTVGGDRVCCSYCNGRGRRQCYTCHSVGRQTCPTCQGHLSLLWYIQLTVKFVNHVSVHVHGADTLPSNLIPNATGQTLFSEQGITVQPVGNFPQQEINAASMALVTSHRDILTRERPISQRHTIRTVPIAQCSVEHSGKPFSFFVYGNERSVYTNDYPQTCCCGCNIL